jgi:hypothetical protein
MLLGAADASIDRPGVEGDLPLPVVTIAVQPSPPGHVLVGLSCPVWRPLRPQKRLLDTAKLETLIVDAAQYGEHLGRALFEGSDLGRQLDELRNGLLREAGGFRIRLRLDDPRTAGVRWERLMVPWGGTAWRPLATMANTPVSRVAYYDTTMPRVELIEGRVLRALLVIASPSDLPAQLGHIEPADRDFAKRALNSLGPDVIELTVLESGTANPPSIDRLRAALSKRPHLVHVLCHGELTKHGGVLFIEDAVGQCYGFAGTMFADALQSAGTQHPRLVVLAACESASPDSAKGTRAVAPDLVARGADAVLAMHGPVSVPTASAFTTAFYARLYEHGQVDVAAAEARAAVMGAWDWSVPVLFMRHDAGRILEFDIGHYGRAVLGPGEAVAHDLQNLPATARRENASDEVLAAMDALQQEFVKTHEFLVGLADAFRRTGTDLATFKSAFERFRFDFEKAYEAKTWIAEQTSCHRVGEEWEHVRPFFSLLVVQKKIDHDTFARLDSVMGTLSSADADTIHFMGQLLDEMKAEVDRITDRLEEDDVPGAIAAKRAFERRLSDSFRRSKEFMQTIARHVHEARAA